MASETKSVGSTGKYVWEPAGKDVSIAIGLDVIDRLSQDVMRGFGAVPKRGAEVGGILVGKVQANVPLTIEIEDYELVPIEYKRGPSYLLSEGDFQGLEEAYHRLLDAAKEPGRRKPVGLFRSHTRDTPGLVAEDSALVDRFLPGPEPIFLLIKPYATKVSTAGFYVREGTGFPSGPPVLEFPFRRKELGGDGPGAPAPMPPIGEEKPLVRSRHTVSRELVHVPSADPTGGLAPESSRVPEPPPPARAKQDEGRSGWVWLPLSFIFFLVGVLLGFQAAVILRPQPAAPQPYVVSLSVTKDGRNLSIHWDRQSTAIRNALRGVLVIEDGSVSRQVPLSRIELETGSVVYPPNTPKVKLWLDLTFTGNTVLTEKLEWRE